MVKRGGTDAEKTNIGSPKNTDKLESRKGQKTRKKMKKFIRTGLITLTIVFMFLGCQSSAKKESESTSDVSAEVSIGSNYRIVETGQNETYDSDGNEISTA